MARSLVLRPTAKVNLMLRVGARRADGFHEIRTLFQSVAVSDTLRVTARPGPLVLQVRAPGVPADRTNLVWRAAEALWRALDRPGEPRDVHLKLEKRIPTGAGLGGGSADAAAALAGLNLLWGARRTRRDLMRVAAGLGADVPFFLHGGTVLGAGRGDEIYPVDDVTRLGLIVIKPSFSVPTADAYRWLDEDRAAGAEQEAARVREVDVGWPGGPLVLVNELQAPVARRHPDITDLVAACYREGAMGAAMTGSGSAVFAVFSEAQTARAANRLRRPDRLVLLTRTLSRREAGRHIGL